jgi:hypothetical protein
MIKDKLIELVQSTEVPAHRIAAMCKELDNHRTDLRYNVDYFKNAIKLSNINTDRLGSFLRELENVKQDNYKKQQEDLFIALVSENVKDAADFTADQLDQLNAKTVSQIVKKSGADVKPQRAGVIISSMGYKAGKNKNHKNVYLCV